MTRLLPRAAFAAALIFAASLTLKACDSSDGGSDDPKPLGTYATFNAGLAYGFVAEAEQRKPLIGPAVAALEADVVCLQEVWLPADAQAVINATAEAFPHSYWVDMTEEGGGAPACTPEELNPLSTCAADNCADEPQDQLVTCATENCPNEFTALGEDCLGCLAGQLGKPMDEMIRACGEEGGSVYAYDGTNGLVLLSRWPLSGTKSITMDSSLNRRAALFAWAERGEGDLVAVACTHLSAAFDNIPYTGAYETWEGEQAYQIQEIVDMLDDTVTGGEPTVLLGDFNIGPELAGIDGDVVQNWPAFGDAGLFDPFTASDAPKCTYCEENPLNVDVTRNVLIDHVFFRNWPEDTVYAGQRVLDQTIQLELGGVATDSRLSDHYGVAVTTSAP